MSENNLREVLERGNPPLADFLDWLGKRLHLVYHENSNVDFVQACHRRAGEIRAALAATQEPQPAQTVTINQRAPMCRVHGEWMILSFYDRPGSPPGNSWVCRSCARDRAAGAPAASGVLHETLIAACDWIRISREDAEFIWKRLASAAPAAAKRVVPMKEYLDTVASVLNSEREAAAPRPELASALSLNAEDRKAIYATVCQRLNDLVNWRPEEVSRVTMEETLVWLAEREAPPDLACVAVGYQRAIDHCANLFEDIADWRAEDVAKEIRSLRALAHAQLPTEDELAQARAERAQLEVQR